MPKQIESPLTDEQVETFRTVLKAVVAADLKAEHAEDYDAFTELLNQLYFCGVDEYEYRRFANIVSSAEDDEMRSPK